MKQNIKSKFATPASQVKIDQETTEQSTATPASQVITDQVTTEQASATPRNSDQKPPLLQKPLFTLKQKPSETPPNDREQKKIDTSTTPIYTLNENDNSLLYDSFFSLTQRDPLITLHLCHSRLMRNEIELNNFFKLNN